MDGIVYPPIPLKSYIEVLSPNVTIFGDRAFREMNKFKWDHKWGTLNQEECPYQNRRRHHRAVSPCIYAEKVMWGYNKEAMCKLPHQESILTALWSWTSSFQNYGQTNFCYLSYLVSGILLQQNKQINAVTMAMKVSKTSQFWFLPYTTCNEQDFQNLQTYTLSGAVKAVHTNYL
jgi:hypothetical protein